MANIRELLNKVKNAIYGKDVRQSIHDAIEECYNTASMDHDNANMEVKLARGTFDTLNERLDDQKEDIDSHTSKIGFLEEGKRNKAEKIKGTDLDITSDANKIKLVNLSDEVQRAMAGNAPVNPVIPDEGVTTEKIAPGAATHSKVFRQIQPVHLFGYGDKYNFVFDGENKQLKIILPPYSHLVVGTSFYQAANNIGGVETVVVDYPSKLDGVNYLFYRISNKQWSIVHYQLASSEKTDNDLLLVGVLTFGNGGFVSAIGDYDVNYGSGSDDMNISFHENIKFDRKKGKLYIPNFYVKSRNTIVGKYITPAQCGLSTKYFEFDIPSNFDFTNIVLKYSRIKKHNSTEINNENPFEQATLGNLPSYHKKDIVIASSIYGNLTSRFNFENIGIAPNTQYNIGTICGRDYPNFKPSTNEINFGFCFVMHNNTYYTVSESNRIVEYDISRDGVYFIWYNTEKLGFDVYHYTEISQNDLSIKKVFVGSFWGGAKITAQLMGLYKVEGVLQGGQTVELPTYDAVENRLIVPDDLFLIKGDEIELYKSSLIPNSKSTEQMRMSLNYKVGNTPKYKYFYEDITLKEEELPGTLRIGVRQYKDGTLYYKDINKRVADPAAATNKTPTIIHIGDSITNRRIAYWNDIILKEKGINAKFVGTIVNQGDKRGEGREGWRYSNYVGQHNIYMNNNQPIVPFPSGDTTNLNQNPFLKLATEQDKTEHPGWCFRNTGAAKELSYEEDTNKEGDFYIFDFEYYLSNHSVDNPDIITIALSTNDINTLSWWEESCGLGLEIMYKQIRKVLPNAKIGIIPSPAWGYTNDNWRVKTCKWIELCMKQVKSYNDSKLFIVPIWCHINREWTFPLGTSTDISEINSSKKVNISDSIHFGTDGEQQYGKAMASFCINMII